MNIIDIMLAHPITAFAVILLIGIVGLIVIYDVE